MTSRRTNIQKYGHSCRTRTPPPTHRRYEEHKTQHAQEPPEPRIARVPVLLPPLLLLALHLRRPPLRGRLRARRSPHVWRGEGVWPLLLLLLGVAGCVVVGVVGVRVRVRLAGAGGGGCSGAISPGRVPGVRCALSAPEVVCFVRPSRRLVGGLVGG